MTLDSMAILTFCDGERREPPLAQVLLTRWELGVLGYALRWPLAGDDRVPGGRYLAEAAQRYAPAHAARGYALAVPEGDTWVSSVPHDDEADTGDSGYWLDAAQIRRIFTNLSDLPARSAILAHATGGQPVSQPPDRLIACLQMLAQATERGLGIHFAYYLC
ncbi:MAG: hypothetical protein OHK0022_18640 [Roseiflexaceae bacterium]